MKDRFSVCLPVRFDRYFLNLSERYIHSTVARMACDIASDPRLHFDPWVIGASVANLTIYLLREEFASAASAVEGLLAESPVIHKGKRLGTLFLRETKEDFPKWTRLFSGMVDQSLFPKVKTVSALYVTEVSGRLFALAFGHGRHFIRAGAYEDRFGLLVVINSLKSTDLRSIDKRTFDTVDQNVRSQVSQRSAASEFGIDIEKDLIRAITGQPTSGSGKTSRMSGADSITISADTSIPKLDRLLKRYLEAFKSDAYKKNNFGWIDHIRQVNDSDTLKDRLDERLVDEINKVRFKFKTAADIWLALPEIVNYEGIHRFRFTGSNINHYDIHLPGFFDSLSPNEKIDIDILKKRCAFAVNDDGYNIGEKWSIYKCIHFEADIDGNSYILALGKWFRIKSSFLDEVREFYENLPVKNLGWIEYRHKSEGLYNKEIHELNPELYALMDAVDIPVGGVRDKMEFCDIYSKNRELIHIKRYGGSNVLGHLFNQGLVSGEHLRMYPGFVNLVNTRIDSSHRLNLNEKVPREISDYTIVFAVISEDQEDYLHLPFFAKVALKHVCARLQSLGYTKIFMSKIKVDYNFSREEKARKRKNKINKPDNNNKKTTGSARPLITQSPVSSDKIGKKQVYKAR